MALKRGFSRGQRVAEAAEGLGTAVVLVFLVVAIVYAATRPAARVRLDLTESKQYTLQPQTENIVGELDSAVEIITLMRPEPSVLPTGLGAVQAEAAEFVRNLLHEYEIASGGRVTVRHLDPHVDRAETQLLVRDLVLSRYNVVLVHGESRTKQLFLEDLVTIDRGMADQANIQPAELVALHAEGPLTSAILSVSSEVPPRVGFLQGIGGPQATDFDELGMGIFVESVRLQGLDPKVFDLVGGNEVPEALDVVVLVGPSRALDEDVVAALRRFQEDGGSLLLALDPGTIDARLDGLLAALGIGRGQFVLCRDDALAQGYARALIPIRSFSNHEIAEPIGRAGWYAQFPFVGGVARHRDTPPEVLVDRLAWTEPDVWGDAPGASGVGDFEFDPETESRGTRAVAVAREAPGDGRVVVLGTSHVLTNQNFRNAANQGLCLNAVNWLVGREEALETGAMAVQQSRVELIDNEREEIFTYVVLLMPLGGALLGALVWFTRRR